MPEETSGLIVIHEQLQKLNQAVFEKDEKFELLKKHAVLAQNKKSTKSFHGSVYISEETVGTTP